MTPAWEELLRTYHLLSDVSAVDAGTLLWIARVIHHRVAGTPVGEVAQRLQDDVRRVAGLAEPT